MLNLGGYQRPCLVNAKQVANIRGIPPQEVYLHFEFTKPGRHFYTVHSDDEFYLHRCLVPNRTEATPDFHLNTPPRGRDLDSNCFSEYVEETEMIKHLTADKALWRLSKIAKTPDQLFELVSFLQQQYLHLNEVHLAVRAWAQEVEGIPQARLTEWLSREVRIASEMQSKSVVQAFAGERVPRYVFVEILVALSDKLYLQPGKCEKLTEGLKLIF